MEIIQICPICGHPALEVNRKAVMYNLVGPFKNLIDPNSTWNLCNNPSCDCAYFSKNLSFKTSDLKSPLFFKDKSENVPICYCSEITRAEIKKAVKNGCFTIDDVQKFTKKELTCLCEERNPLGKCCRKVFLRTISDYSGM